MFELSGYRVVESMGSNEEISLYRILCLEDNTSYIAKTISDTYTGTNMTAAFKYEYEQLLRLDGKGVLKPHSLEIAAGRPILLLRDCGGTTLAQVLRTRRASLSVKDLLGAAIAMVDCLRHMHHTNITLHEITPLHLIMNEGLNEAKLIDIRACSIETEQSKRSLAAGRVESNLPYLSPEQTGRTERVPDYRSDFYSIGVLLYEWFAGTLPFQSEHALDMVYHHLATTPEPVHLNNQFIPRIVSDILNKCMEKMPEARYASAYGIRTDLEECLVQYRETGKVQPFLLADHDVTERWIMSEGLFGRSAEQQMLLQAMHRVSGGTAEVIWINGDTGMGKTSLVRETYRKGVPNDGFFAASKIEYSTTTQPYALWVQVAEELVVRLLTLSQYQVEVWKLKMIDALQDCGQLLIDLVPRLELLIGEQPAIDELPPAEAQTRLHLVLNRFFQLFYERNQPLVLFFDDLQWADEVSIQYLYHLLEDRKTMHLLIVGAYNDDELLPLHPFRRLMKQLEDKGIPMKWVHLRAYDHSVLKQMLLPIFDGITDGVDELTDVLLHKTGGNPLFLKQFMQDILDRKLVSFDEQNRMWHWNVQLIAEMNVPEDNAASISSSIQQLPDQMIYILGRAAILGKQFDLHTLSLITGLSMVELFEWVQCVVGERLLQLIHTERMTYIFQHEHIRQSAYKLVAEQERLDLHMEIGWLLARRMSGGEDIRIFEVLHHLNQAVEQVILQGKGLDLVKLNLQAGLNAKQSIAFESSLTYLQLATDLLDEHCWDNCYSLTYQVYKERAEVEFLCTNFATAQTLFNLLLQKANTDYDKAEVCIRMLQLETNRESYHEIIALGEKALKLLGLPNRLAPSTMELLTQWTRVRWKLRKHPVESIGNLPLMTDERRKAAMSVLFYTSNASFALNKNGWVSSILTMLEMTMDYGKTPESSIGFVGYAMLLNFQFKQYEAAYKWGKLACAVSRHSPKIYAQVYTAFSLCYGSWSKYEQGFLVAFADHADKAALQSGDLWQANHTMLINCGLLFQFSHPINDIYKRFVSHSSNFRKEDNILHWKQAAIQSQLFSTLTGQRAMNDPFLEADIEDSKFLADVSGGTETLLQELVYLYQYITGYLLGNYKKAYVALEQSVINRLPSSAQLLDPTSHYYYFLLVLKEVYEGGNKQEKTIYMRKIVFYLGKLKLAARKSPENNAHKYLLAKAEIARLKHKTRQAEHLFEQALDTARKHGHFHDVGIIAECYANFAIQSGRPMLAKLYLTEAYESYLSWGALAKTAQMESKFGHLLQLKRGTESDLERMDYLSVVMTAQALSGEMEMDKLLHMLMRIMLHNAGAEYGALIFNNEDQWMVEAYGTAEKLIIEAIPLDDADKLVPIAVIGYTARTKEEIVLHDVASNSMFGRNAYIKNKEVKSVLCLPIMHQNKLICLLYMENNLSTGVFTEKRLDVLKMLSSQCAISIANAKLFSGIQYLKNSLEDQVLERTHSLEKSMQATSEALAETTVYAERNRIAQEIHDIVGHSLTSTILQIEAGKRLLRKDTDSAVIRFKEAQDLVRHSLNEIRNSVHMLKEDKYYDIVEALQSLIKNTERNTGVVVHALIDPPPHLSSIQKKLVYHALQEGLTNGIRHGESDQFNFSLRNDGSLLQFRLADNGTGASHIVMGFGLKMMRDRVQQLNGTLYIDSEPNKGCLLRINFPYGA